MPNEEQKSKAEIYFHSEEASDILGKLPAWIVRRGITVIFLIFVGILIGCYFIKYPQTVDAPVIITTLNPPADLIARAEGRIDTIYVADGQNVKKNDIIALLYNTADYEAVRMIEDSLKQSYKKNFAETVFEKWIENDYNIGDLQANYEAFKLLCMDYRHYVTTDYTNQKKRLLQQQIGKNAKYHSQLTEQQNILGKDLGYEYSSLTRDSLLYAKGIISKSEYENSLRNSLQTENAKTGFDANLTSTELNIMQMQQQIIELTIQRNNEIAEYERQLSQRRQQLVSQIEQWKYQYLIETPAEGKITFINYWNNNQQVRLGERIASVIPNDSMQIIGRMYVPSSGFGKVEKGQTVNVRLNGYPYMEFGMLKGFIKNISAVPDVEKGYVAEVVFPEGLFTTYRKHLNLIQQMDGQAEIITKDLRLIEQFLQPIRALFDER
ncbi:MAG: HlyD family secretion protein [Prevotellaceae bacterium]|jgi:multidrug efflux pump subunit AcrA (membrane-fusion protein)|nr:HlyD family secretion protein [Prevotellaceae bacterium]